MQLLKFPSDLFPILCISSNSHHSNQPDMLQCFIGFTIQQLDRVMEGKIEVVIEALITEDQKRKLSSEQE